ncbi:translation initiation factor IF-2-like [Schistocerca cancellata]|uniref:translation initiation factor IF-2-like n=1 Tax=Schistocerca cancellata TaxID=274614 RepID=UPI002118204D|nr:translation initiation factor IF-2-like [Schistocerca cancellata]
MPPLLLEVPNSSSYVDLRRLLASGGATCVSGSPPSGLEKQPQSAAVADESTLRNPGPCRRSANSFRAQPPNPAPTAARPAVCSGPGATHAAPSTQQPPRRLPVPGGAPDRLESLLTAGPQPLRALGPRSGRPSRPLAQRHAEPPCWHAPPRQPGELVPTAGRPHFPFFLLLAPVQAGVPRSSIICSHWARHTAAQPAAQWICAGKQAYPIIAIKPQSSKTSHGGKRNHRVAGVGRRARVPAVDTPLCRGSADTGWAGAGSGGGGGGGGGACVCARTAA